MATDTTNDQAVSTGRAVRPIIRGRLGCVGYSSKLGVAKSQQIALLTEDCLIRIRIGLVTQVEMKRHPMTGGQIVDLNPMRIVAHGHDATELLLD